MKNFVMTSAAAFFSLGLVGAASAQNFQFEETGSANGKFELEFTAEETITQKSGAEYSFNGGSGTEGNVLMKADDFTIAGGVSAQYAGGDGESYSNTNGTNYAVAKMESGAFNANGAFGLSQDFGPNATSKVSYDGTALAGGAGSTVVGSSNGTKYELNVAGKGSGSYKLKQAQTTTP